ncbi:MAG: choice-of-anchor D domain-containing protein [Micromonosporaceae bacterium]
MSHVNARRAPGAARPLAALLLILGLAALTAAPAQAAVEGRPCQPEPTDEEIFYGDVITCDISPQGDSDVFRFQGTTGEQVFATTVRPSGYVSPCVQLFRPSGGTPFASACTATGKVFTVGGTLDETGLWTVTVVDGGSPNVGPYTLVLDRLAPASPAGEPVNYGGTVTGDIDPLGDADLYIIGGGLGSTISIQTARVSGGVQPCIALYDPDGVLVATDCPSTGSAFAITATLAKEGTHTIHVADRGNNDIGAYSLTLQCLAGTCPNLHTVTIIAGPSGTPNPVKSGGTAALDVTVVDSFSHPLTYAWSATCAAELGSNGAFSSETAPSPTWTAPVNTTAVDQECTIHVAVSDDHGLGDEGSYVQKVYAILPPDITVTPLALDFGSIAVGTTSEAQNVLVKNDGLTDDLIIKSVSLTGLAFKKTADGCSSKTLAPGQSCTVSVVFKPGSTGDKSSTLSIPSNDPDASENPVRVKLTGTGVTGGGGGLVPDIAVSPLSLGFGDVAVGSISPAQTVTVSNEGTGDVLVKSVSLTGTAFRKASDACSSKTLAPGQSCTVSVEFKPGSTGAKTGTLSIPSNDPDAAENPVKVTLTGTGVTGGGGGGTPDIAVTPLALDLGSVAVGSTSAPQAVTVSNEGTGDLVVKTVSVSGTQFKKTADNCTGQTLAPAQSCTVSVYLKPTTRGDKSSILSIPSNDPDTAENPVKVQLTGTGI